MKIEKKFVAVAPTGVFSGFERTFFESIMPYHGRPLYINVEIPYFKLLCTIKSFYPKKAIWGTRRDKLYHTSMNAFKKKSVFAKQKIGKLNEQYDFIYQIGTLWNPIPLNVDKPFVLSVDYTSKLSEKRNSEWKRKEKEKYFWISEEKKIYNRANVICATTQNAKKSLVNDYDIPESKIHVVGPGISAPYDILEEDKIPAYDSKKIVFVGKGYKGKGLDTLIKAFKIVRREVVDSTLTIIGPSTKIHGKGINFIDRIKDKNIVKQHYYKSAVFVMPSIFEPVGQVFLEAMSCKLPCIGTTLDAMPELIEDNYTGFTIKPGDYKILADHLIYLLNNPAIGQKMGINGYNKLKNEYTWEIVGGKISRAINSML